MGIAINCRGCGQPLQVNDNETRPEIECLWCGAKSPVPGRAAPPVARPTAKPSPKPSPIAAGPPPVSAAAAIAAGPPPRPASPAAIAAGPAPPAALVETQKPEPAWHQQTPYGVEGPPLQSDADVPSPFTSAVSVSQSSRPQSPQRQSPAPGRTFSEAPDDDGTPYGVSEKLNYRCQECGRVLHGEVVLCPSCGFNHATGQKVERVYEPVARKWEAGLPYERRLRLFIVTQVVMVFLAAVTSWATGSMFSVLPGWMLIAGMTAFLIGTYDRVELTRTRRGKVSLKHTWRFCFVEQATRTLPLGQFEGITFGKSHDPSFWDWIGFVLLLTCGVLPGIVFWYYCIYSEMFFVALTKDHGHPEHTLYRGWNESHMRDVHDTVRAVVFPVTV
jgi:hypothetical protein